MVFMKTVFLCVNSILIICLAGCSNIADGLRHVPSARSEAFLYDYSITINDFEDVTYTRDVVISVNPGGASGMRFSNDGLTWSSWEGVGRETAWVLSPYSSVKTVYAEFSQDGSIISSASDDIEFIEKLLPVTLSDSDSLGSSVAVSSGGSTVIAGAPNFAFTNSSGFTYRSGAAIIYTYDGIRWSSQVLVPGGASGADRFGESVSINGAGDLAAVGSPGYNSGAGRVFLYRYSSVSGRWEFSDSVTGEAGSYFGNSVAFSRDGLFLVCGAVSGNGRKGEALLYSVSYSGLTYVDSFRAENGLAEDRFGCSVAVNNDASVVVIGAEQRRVGDYTNSGIIYVFENTGTSYEQGTIQCDDPDYNTFFGCSTSVSSNGNVICAGAKGHSLERGSVFAFRDDDSDGVYMQYNLSVEEGRPGDQSGYSVALSGDGSVVVAGAPYADNGATDSGRLARFTFNGSAYVMTDIYCPSDPTSEKHLGISSAVNNSGDIHITGAIKDIYDATGCGTSYVFRVP